MSEKASISYIEKERHQLPSKNIFDALDLFLRKWCFLLVVEQTPKPRKFKKMASKPCSTKATQ
jgi:hypothetical protein